MAVTLTGNPMGGYRDSLRRLGKVYDKPVARVSTALLLTIFTTVIFGFLAVRPTLATISQLLKKIEDQQEVKDKLDKKVAALSTAQSEYLLADPKIPLIEAAIPSEHQLNKLLKQIEAVAAAVQVPINGIGVGEMVLKDSGQTQDNQEVVEVPVVVNIEANYQQLISFLEAVSQMPRIVNAETISFIQENTEESAVIKMSVQLKAYYLPVETVSDEIDY